MCERIEEQIQEVLQPAEPAAEPVSENPLFREPAERRKPLLPVHTTSLVLGILSILFSLLSVLVGEVLGVVGICTAVSRRQQNNVTPGLVCSIIGLALSVLGHIMNIILMVSA